MNFKTHKLQNKLVPDYADKDAKMLIPGRSIERADSPDDNRLLSNIELGSPAQIRPILNERESLVIAQEETKEIR